MASEKYKGLKVGILFTIGIIIIFAAIFIIGSHEGIFAKSDYLFIRFQDVEGLVVGSQVRLGGVRVGAVQEIFFPSDIGSNEVLVKISIKSESFNRIRTDSRVTLGSMGLLGDRTVDISIGSGSQPPMQPGQYISAISTFGLENLISATEPTVGDLKDVARNAKEITWKINQGEGSLAKIINDPRLYSNLDSLLILWSDISGKINSGEGNVSLIMNDTSLYTNMARFFGMFSQFMDTLNAGRGTLNELIYNKNLYNHTDSLLVSLNEMMEGLNNSEGTLGLLMHNAELYRKLNATLASLDSLLVDIRYNPKRYVKFSLF